MTKRVAAMTPEQRAQALAASRRYRTAHREEDRARSAAWAKAHPEEFRARYSRWHAANPDRDRARSAAWRAAHVDELRSHDRKFYALARGAHLCTHEDCLAVEASALAWRIHPHVCYLCGVPVQPGANLHMDHVLPIKRGGLHCADNIRPACASCNLTKRNRTAEEFLSA